MGMQSFTHIHDLFDIHILHFNIPATTIISKLHFHMGLGCSSSKSPPSSLGQRASIISELDTACTDLPVSPSFPHMSEMFPSIPTHSVPLIRLLSPWPMKSWFSQFPMACPCPPVLAHALLHSCALHAPQSAFPCFAAFPRCERLALLPVLVHPCVCPLAPSLANAP